MYWSAAPEVFNSNRVAAFYARLGNAAWMPDSPNSVYLEFLRKKLSKLLLINILYIFYYLGYGFRVHIIQGIFGS